ncbi:MAG: choline-sulfatase, partial [Bacteroidia bacterium]
MYRVLFYLLAVLLLSACGNKKDPPNILFVFADDQCYNTIRELGNEEVFTPTLDEMARHGTVFTTA